MICGSGEDAVSQPVANMTYKITKINPFNVRKPTNILHYTCYIKTIKYYKIIQVASWCINFTPPAPTISAVYQVHD